VTVKSFYSLGLDQVILNVKRSKKKLIQLDIYL